MYVIWQATLWISIKWIKQHSFKCWRETGGPIVLRRGQPFDTGWAHQQPLYNSRGKYEDLSNALENLVILIWLQLTQKDLHVLVKQRYCTELRSQTLASIKQEISESLDMYANELDASHESLILKTVTAFLKQTNISVKKART